MKCKHCKKEYETESKFLEDCFVSSDGWSWEYFHNCLKEKDYMELHGYRQKKDPAP